jgi:hypothetical protein
VLVRTSRRSYDQAQTSFGLALLSGKDGSILWRQTLIPAHKTVGPKGEIYPDALRSDGGLAVVNLRPSMAATVADIQLIAVDPRTGRRLWTRSGVELAAIAPGAVIVEEWPNAPSTPLGVITADGATLAVLDTLTGQTRWSLRDQLNARVAGATSGLLLVREWENNLQKNPILLDLASGRELGRMPAQTASCADDRSMLIACEGAPEISGTELRLFTVRADEQRARVAGRPLPDGRISLVRDGRIYLSDTDSPDTVIDRSGTPLGGALPDGFLRALSDKYAIFLNPDASSGRYQVYRVG